MSKLSDHIDKSINDVLRANVQKLDFAAMDDNAAIALGVGLNDYLRKSIAIHAAQRAAATIEAAEAYRSELPQLQDRAAREIAEATGLEENKIDSLLGTLSMAASRYQPNRMELKAQLLGEIVPGRKK